MHAHNTLFSINSKTELTMTSREIAGLVEKRHDNVKRTIETLAERGVIRPPQIEVSEKINNLGLPQKVESYLIGKRDSFVVVAQLSPEFTARLVDRWQALERKQSLSLPDFNNPVEAARAWADAKEAEQAALKQIEFDRPKVEFAMAVRNMDGACDIGDFAKVIGTGRNRLFSQLKADKILMMSRRPYQKYIDMGYFVVIEQIPYTDSDGKTHPTFKTLLTGKGQVWLERKYRIEAA